jgi:Flp pilus assembly protein TadG
MTSSTASSRGADRSRSGRTGERASAAVEFALVLPLLLVMGLALLQVGLYVKDRLVLEGAARAGARHGAVSTDEAEVRQKAIDSAASLDPDLLDVTVRREGGTGDPVTVTIVYHAPIVVPLVEWLFPSVVDLTATAVMRQETG